MSQIPDEAAQFAFTFCPPGFASCIAGGAVLDFERAKDIDLWVLAGDRMPEEVAALTHDHIDLMGYKYEMWQPYPQRHMFKVADVPFTESKPVQVMVYPAHRADQLLELFDISVHMHALLPDGRLMNVGKSTKPGETIRVVRFDTPYSTLRRYFAFCQRYSAQIVWNDVEELCEEIARRRASRKKEAAL